MSNIQIADIITKECKQKNIKISELLNLCGINHSFISDMRHKNRAPSVDKISVIADYLGVSVDYLLGREEITVANNPQIENSTAEKHYDETTLQVATAFQQLDFISKAKVMSLIAELTEKTG